MKLDSNFFQKGLTNKQAAAALIKAGPNEFSRKKEYSLLKIFFSQLASPLIYILLIAGLVTIYLHEWFDTAVIMLVVLINTFLGFYQEKKAAKALQALKTFLKPKAMVIRDGEKKTIPLSEVVPGDICLISAGQSIPADGVIVAAQDLRLSESILTGESRSVHKTAVEKKDVAEFADLEMVDPQSKEARHWLYMGTVVKSGVGRLLVVATGQRTEIGKIAQTLVTLEERPTPLSRKLAKLSKFLSILVAIGTIIILLLGIWRGESFGVMLETAVAIAVSAIPEGLVVSLTVVLSLGMQKVFKQKALVRKLLAAETLGSVTVICCDKTGTLTEGVLTVSQAIGSKKNLVKAAILINDEVDEIGDALIGWAKEELKQGSAWTKAHTVAKLKNQYQRLISLPFSSERKYTAALLQKGNNKFVFMMGAPELILSRTNLSQVRRREEQDRLSALAQQGLRMVAVATKKVEHETDLETIKNLEWQGLFAFEDQIRPGVEEALKMVQKAGVDVKIITGDFAETAITVLKKIGFSDQQLTARRIITGEELKKLSSKELREKLKEVVLFARTTPDQKLKIVQALQKMGEVVAMTGDGVNDAPALKAADIGVVVNEASDVSKETADMVLLDSNFRSIVMAIKEGRIIVETMKKIITYLLTDVFAGLIVFGGSLIMGWPLPITAVQILWINLVEDGLPGISLAFEESDDDVMEDKPHDPEGSIFDTEMKTLITIIGLADVLILVLYNWLRQIGLPMIEIRTIIFVLMATDSLLYLFSVKSLRKNIWQENLLGNKFLLGSVIFSFFTIGLSVYWQPLQTLLSTTSLKVSIMVGLFMIGVVQLAVVELIKWYFIKRRAKAKLAA